MTARPLATCEILMAEAIERVVAQTDASDPDSAEACRVLKEVARDLRQRAAGGVAGREAADAGV